MAWAPAAINAAATVSSAVLNNMGKGGNESKMQRTKRKLIDQLLSSIQNGGGAFGDLFNADEGAFQKSFVEPAQSMFRNKIAPSIQQQFIASGQQRGTGLDDQLMRAGVDLDSMLNEKYYNFQQDAMNRKQNSINSILGSGDGAAPQTSMGQDVFSTGAGYLQSEGFNNFTNEYFKPQQQKNTMAPIIEDVRPGFEKGK